MINTQLLQLYTAFGIVILLVSVSVKIGQIHRSQPILQCLCSLCAILSISLPILIKCQLFWFSVDHHLIGILSSVTGFLFSLKIIEIAFTYDWLTQKQMTLTEILLDFSTFPRTKYQSCEEIRKQLTKPRLVDYADYLILGGKEEQFSARQQNLMMMCRGLSQWLCLHIILHQVPHSILSLHSRTFDLLSLSNFLIYTLYAFILYFALGMLINLTFGFIGFVCNVYLHSIYPGYPFLATSLHDFWSHRWNFYVKTILHRLTFIALPKLIRFSVKSPIHLAVSGWIAFFISGLLHEFMFFIAMDDYQSTGKSFLFFMIHGTLVAAELTIKKLAHRKRLVHPFVGWLWTVCALYVTSSLFFDPCTESDCLNSLKSYFG